MKDYSKYINNNNNDFILGYKELDAETLKVYKANQDPDICKNNTEDFKNYLNSLMENQVINVNWNKLNKDMEEENSIRGFNLLGGVICSCLSMVYLLNDKPIGFLFAVLAVCAFKDRKKILNELRDIFEDYEKSKEYLKYKDDLESLLDNKDNKEEILRNTLGFDINSLENVTKEDLENYRKTLKAIKHYNDIKNVSEEATITR